MNTGNIQNLTKQITNLYTQNDALVNLLVGYCENYRENPTKECLFDLLLGLEQLKQYSKELRKIIFELGDL